MIRHCIYKVQQKADTTGDRWLLVYHVWPDTSASSTWQYWQYTCNKYGWNTGTVLHWTI